MVLLSDDIEDPSKLLNVLEEIDKNWYLGMDNECEWRNAVLSEIPYLFCVNAMDASSETGIY